MLSQTYPRRFRGWMVVLATLALFTVFAVPAQANREAAPPPAFDLDHGNAVLQVIFPALQTTQGTAVSPDGSDITVIVDTAMLLELPWFDAIAPYHPTAVGIFSNLGRRPASEATTRNKNIAVLYSSYRSFLRLIPEFRQQWRDMMSSVGLDPDDAAENTTTPAGLGNLAARKAFEAREHDGTNRDGDEGGVKYNREKYADYTGYRPVNTAYRLRHPSRWQPDIVTNGQGTFTVQQFENPQMRLAKPITYDNPARFPLAPPRSSDYRNRAAYKQQADQVLAASAGMTDTQKMTSELINDKFLSIGAVTAIAAAQKGLDTEKTVQFITTVEIANFDATIAVWHQKVRYDSVRPFSAIRYLYGDRRVRAWGGPGKGTVDDITGNEWRSYLQTADHPDYPSGSAAICAGYTRAASRFLGSDQVEIAFPQPAGSSRIEPGVTPKQDLLLHWSSWSTFSRDCGLSRFWSGVHFPAAVDAGQRFGPQFGDRAYTYVQRKLAGTR